MTVENVALTAFLVLVAATAARIWSVLRLMHGFRVTEYDAQPVARRLLAVSRWTFVATLASIVVLGSCSRIWWVEVACALVTGLAAAKFSWALALRRSGRHVAWYAARGWK